MSEHIDGDYIIYSWPHKKIMGYMASYFQSYWKPRLFFCDPVSCTWKKGKHRHFSWFSLAREWYRLLFKGSREYRWD